MDATTPSESALVRFRAAVSSAYGTRLERVVLFGSRARGDARPDSDYDIAVFLHDMGDLWDELRPLGLTDITRLLAALPTWRTTMQLRH